MILQQYYTRERRGIFRTAEGYDTIAKSPSLDNNLIKKVFHSYCFYDPPRELQVAGEKDSNKYPKALTFLQLDTDEAILGQSVYVPVDFTGQRSTFFTHNYLIPKDIKENFIKHPEKILYASGFHESYDIEKGSSLEEIRDLSYTRQNYDGEFINDLFAKLGVTEDIFKDLIHAVCLSVASRKKVYIALDVEASEISKYSKRLLLCILESLPYEIRRKVGFMSYIQRPDSKKGINVMFVDKDSVRHRTSGTNQDFIFDFSNKQFPKIKLGSKSHPYLDFIWEYRGNKSVNTSLYNFMDQVLSHSNHKSQVDILTYDNLAVLYQIIAGDNGVYVAFKDQIFTYILYYLNEKNINEQILLTNLAKSTIRKESKVIATNESYMSVKFAQDLIPYYPLATEEDKAYICNLFLSSLINAKNNHQEPYMLELFESLQNSGSLIKQLISEIIGNPKVKDYILKDYLALRLDKIKNISQWSKEVENLRSIAYEIIDEPYFQRQSTGILLTMLEMQKNITLSAKTIYKVLGDFSKGSSRDSRPSDMRYVSYIETQVDAIVVSKLSIRGITKQDLVNFSVSTNRDSQKVKILYSLKDLVILQELHAEQNMKHILGQVSALEKQEIQDAIKNLVLETSDKVNYNELVLGFFKEQTNGDATYNYTELLTFIFTKKGKSGVYNFILWSLDKDGFFNMRTKSLCKGYEKAIKNYFLKLDPEAFKNKELKQQFLTNRNHRITNFFKGVELELASGFKRIFLKYGDKMLLGTKYAFLILIVATALIFGTVKVTYLVLEKMGPSKATQAIMDSLQEVKLENIKLKEEKEVLEQERAKLEKEMKILEQAKELEEPEEADIAQ